MVAILVILVLSAYLFVQCHCIVQAVGPDDMFTTLCLSVPVETVLRHTEGAIKFFVIDTRPLYMFDAGHLPYAWHLDASLMIDKPQIFGEEVAKLEEALTASMQVREGERGCVCVF